MSNFIAVGNIAGYTDTTGQAWAADDGSQASGGALFNVSTPISGTPDRTLYQFGRLGPSISCTFTAPIGIYTITLKLADVFGFLRGQQIFNVFINGSLQKSALDIFYTIQAQNTAYDVVIPSYANLTGTIVVTVSQVSGGAVGAQLQAISIIQQLTPVVCQLATGVGPDVLLTTLSQDVAALNLPSGRYLLTGIVDFNVIGAGDAGQILVATLDAGVGFNQLLGPVGTQSSIAVQAIDNIIAPTPAHLSVLKTGGTGTSTYSPVRSSLSAIKII